MMNDAASIYQSGGYLAANPHWHAEDAPHKARWIMQLLTSQDLAPRHIVEVGCGSGEILVELARLLPAARLEGYDISPQAMAIAAPKATDRIAFRQADYLETETERAELIMAVDVFEHVEDYRSFLRALRMRAEWKLFHIPLDLSVQGLLLGRYLMRARNDVGHLHYFCKDTALAALRDCGYDIVDWNYTHGASELPGKPMRTRLVNVPRKLARLIDDDFAVRLLGGSSLMVLAR